MMLTLSNDTVTPSISLSYHREREKEAPRQRKKKRGKVFPDKMVCSCWRVVIFRAVLECKKLKICVYFCDGYREFFTLCLIRERESERREDGGEN